MDVVWIILDSLSFEVTPWDGGPDTMPLLKELTDERGTIYTNAYVPGPSSPSSHGSLLTGERPAVTGMHEAYPFFDADLPTVPGVLNDTHESLLISANPYISNGIDRDFDHVDDLRKEEYLVFPSATDPEEFVRTIDEPSRIKRYTRFVIEGGKPIRSIINGVQHRRVGQKRRTSLPSGGTADEYKFQYAATMNKRIRRFIDRSEDDVFILANYMDVHPPLDAGDEAIARFTDVPREDLPIGVSGQEVYEQVQSGDDQIGENMYTLFKSAVWETDRKVTPLISDLLKNDTFVVVTADHGSWFRRETELDEERIHVPLILFTPDEESSRVTKTVNLRSLPRTTMEILERSEDKTFSGPSLLDPETNQTSITEYIHNPDNSSNPVDPHGSGEQTVYDIVAVKDDTRVDLVNSRFIKRSGGLEPELKTKINELRKEYERNSETTEGNIEYDTEVKQRLKDFGYLE